VAISKCKTPIPAISVSPVSSFILTIRFGSSTVSLRNASTSFGRSFGCFGSTAIVTTGSETYLIDSNGRIFFIVAMVSPATA
jgi:hypothetical protein